MNLQQLIQKSAVFLAMAVLPINHAFAAGADTFFAFLAGGNEVTASAPNTGDADAFGTATVVLDGTTKICFAIIVNNTDTPTAAHIHAGRAGVAGSAKVTLTAPNGGNPGTSSGCVTTTTTIFNAIKANPASYYINVHTMTFGSGALRGNLF